jgi:hypothetical protein
MEHGHLSNIVFALWSNLCLGSCPVRPAYTAGEWCVQLDPARFRACCTTLPAHGITLLLGSVIAWNKRMYI